jgi:hypothetical protein
MNNTRTLGIAAILIAATLVVGVTFAATTQSAFASSKGDGNENGNTITSLKCQNKGSASGFDTAVDQECENLICTHPGENATRTQEGITSATIPEPGTGTLIVKKVCRDFAGTPCAFTITVTGNNPQPSTFVLQNGDSQLVTLGPGSYTVKETQPPGFISSFAGDCTEIAINGTATGAISAGQHQTCTITNMPER